MWPSHCPSVDCHLLGSRANMSGRWPKRTNATCGSEDMRLCSIAGLAVRLSIPSSIHPAPFCSRVHQTCRHGALIVQRYSEQGGSSYANCSIRDCDQLYMSAACAADVKCACADTVVLQHVYQCVLSTCKQEEASLTTAIQGVRRNSQAKIVRILTNDTSPHRHVERP